MRRAQGDSRAVLSRDFANERGNVCDPFGGKTARIGIRVTQPGQRKSTVAERGVGREVFPVVH